MNIDWKAVGAIGAVVVGIALLHGLTSRKWKDILRGAARSAGLISGRLVVTASAPALARDS